MKKTKNKEVSKSKHQSKVPPGYFLYRAARARYFNIDPEITVDCVTEQVRETMKKIIRKHQDFCDTHCSKQFWEDSAEEESCFFYLLRKKLNELHGNQKSKGKFKCKLHNVC